MAIKSNKILFSEGKNDRCDTPIYGVEPIIKHIEEFIAIRRAFFGLNKTIIWLPFDTRESEYTKLISKIKQVEVVHSHIDDGQDFFHYEPDEWDIMVSNPPFTNTKQIFDRALSFDKPFALLSNLARFNDRNPMGCFLDAGKQPQLLKFDKRIEFKQGSGKANGKITFQTGYLGYDFFQKDFILETIEKKDKK